MLPLSWVQCNQRENWLAKRKFSSIEHETWIRVVMGVFQCLSFSNPTLLHFEPRFFLFCKDVKNRYLFARLFWLRSNTVSVNFREKKLIPDGSRTLSNSKSYNFLPERMMHAYFASMYRRKSFMSHGNIVVLRILWKKSFKKTFIHPLLWELWVFSFGLPHFRSLRYKVFLKAYMFFNFAVRVKLGL